MSISGQALRATMSTRSMAPAVEARPGGAGPVGDALHFFEILFVVAAQEQGVGEGADDASSPARGPWGSEVGGEAADVGGDLGGEEPAVLHAALVGFALRCAGRSSRPGYSDMRGRTAARCGRRAGKGPGRSARRRERRRATDTDRSRARCAWSNVPVVLAEEVGGLSRPGGFRAMPRR